MWEKKEWVRGRQGGERVEAREENMSKRLEKDEGVGGERRAFERGYVCV